MTNLMTTQGGAPHPTAGIALLVLHCGCCPACVLNSGGMAPWISMHMVETYELPDGSLMINRDKEPEDVGVRMVLN